MGEEEAPKVEAEAPAEEPHVAEAPVASAADVAEVKSVVPPPVVEEKPDESKALAIVEKVADPVPEVKPSGGSIDRDIVLTRVQTEKRMSLIKAWEDNEKTKAENKAQKKAAAIGSWEKTKQADVEAELKKVEEKLEKKKAEYAEKMKNKIALIHKAAEEKRAMVEAKRGEDLLKAEEMAAKYRATGLAPKKLLGCF
ncbi:hypothetical protein QJS04_geneDACA001939 [Acorus gramineus]|uniref:Remorin n=1 Tax=Acorus gramineus TaxID=55184 RepID=A0AAV9AAA5_ACOGR|nr:hypothetical protein QJS04_geneDACA001939 [Acorus gramineus]